MSLIDDSDEEEFLLLYALCRKEGVKSTPELKLPPKPKVRRIQKRKLATRNNKIYGVYNLICKDLLSDDDSYYSNFHMSRSSFVKLHDMLQPKILKLDTNFRGAIGTQDRLTICLRYLATGDSHNKLGVYFGVGRSTVRNIVKEVSIAIWETLQPIYMPKPTEDTWRESEIGFRTLWGVPNCLACIEAKHVKFLRPEKSGSDSIVFLALIDHQYKFTAVDIGSYGRRGDNGIFENSDLYKSFFDGQTLLPPKPLPNSEDPVPNVIIGDERFVLRPYLMRPFSKGLAFRDERVKNFNNRLRQARGVVDIAFGQLVEKWHIYKRPFKSNVQMTIETIKATCCLHNFIVNIHGSTPTRLQKKVKSLIPIRRINQRCGNLSIMIRHKFADCLNNM